MNITTKKDEKVMIVSLSGRMDALSSPEFEKEMNDLIDKNETLLVVDCSNLEYISSSGLRSILTVAKKLKTKTGRILLASLTDMVKEVFEISGFSNIIPIHSSLEDALADL